MMLCATLLGAPGSVVVRTASGRSSSRAVPVRHHAALAPRWQQQRQQQPGGSSRSGGVPLTRPRAASSDPLADEDPDTAREAIELGNKYAKAARWPEALAVYEKALTLPGTGLKRFRDKPRGVSDGERSAALFNIACCQSQLGDLRAGLVALAGCLELGYDDFAQLRSDPDLEPLRRDERFEGLLKRFEPPPGPLATFMSGFFGGNAAKK